MMVVVVVFFFFFFFFFFYLSNPTVKKMRGKRKDKIYYSKDLLVLILMRMVRK